jgi:hypothetical protein
MKVDSYSIRGYIANFTDVRTSQVDLDQLVVQYRLSQSSQDYATIYNKVLGVILKFGRQCDASLGITEEDICSQGALTLLRALDPIKGWKADSNVKFITYFHLLVRNDIITLCNKKSSREYQKYSASLDALLYEDEEQDIVACQFSEDESLVNHIETKKESPLIALHKLLACFDDVKEQMAFNLGLSLPKLELAMLAARIKVNKTVQKRQDTDEHPLVTPQEEQYFNEHKKDYREVKKLLRSLV